MSEQIKGVVSRVSEKDLGKGKYGQQFRIGVQLDDEDVWYNIGFSKKQAADMGFVKGRVVSFSYEENDYGNQIDPKTVKTSGVAPASQSSSASGSPAAGRSATRTGPAGVTVGMALNNATDLIASGVVVAPEGGVMAMVEKVARAYLALTAKLEAGDAPASPAKAPQSDAQEDPVGEEGEEEEAPPAPAPKPAAASKGKAAAKPAPKLVKGRPAKQPEPEAETVFEDDDIPFN